MPHIASAACRSLTSSSTYVTKCGCRDGPGVAAALVCDILGWVRLIAFIGWDGEVVSVDASGTAGDSVVRGCEYVRVCVRECDLDRKAPAGGGPSERKYVDLKRSFVVSLPRKLGRACSQSKDVWVPWFLKGDCTPAATPHAKEIDVRIKPFLRSEEVSVRNVHDGVI